MSFTCLPAWFFIRLPIPPGAKLFAFYVFTDLILYCTSGPFGDPLSGLPERGERATKGLQSRPLETCFLMRTPFRRALCLPFRNGAIDAIKSAAALALIPLPLRAAVPRSRYCLRFSEVIAHQCAHWCAQRKCPWGMAIRSSFPNSNRASRQYLTIRQERPARDFASGKANFPQEYFVYCKGNWRIPGTKDPLNAAADL